MSVSTPITTWSLTAAELPPVRLANAAGRAPFALVCDHASPRIPLALADLGLPAHLLGLHIAYDIGAEAMTRLMAEQLDAVAVLASYSRLVIDMNRGLNFEDAIPAVSDGHAIPGNAKITEAERRTRANTLFAPYHGAVAHTLAALTPAPCGPVLIAMHSFTPHMDAFERPWEVAVMWRHDGRIARPLIHALRTHGLNVGDNEPYSAHDPAGYTMHHHAERYGCPSVLIEIRQDLLTEESSIESWAALLSDVLRPILYSPSLYGPAHEPHDVE